MDAAGVELGVLCAWHGPREGALISNDEVAGWVAAHPDPLRGARLGRAATGRWRPCASCAAASSELGFVGLRMLPWLWEVPPDRPALLPALRGVRGARRPVLHPGRPHRPAAAVRAGRPIPYIDQIAIDFPELVIVGGHIGYPWTEEMVAVARKHENVYIDTSAYTTRRLPAGADRLHADGQRRAQGAVRQQLPDDRRRPRRSRTSSGSELDEDGTRLYLHENARRVFGAAPRRPAPERGPRRLGRPA